MEDFNSTPSDEPQPSNGVKPLSFALGLIAALVIGGVIGYGIGLYQAAQQPPEVVEVEVVVTATPDPEQAVAQAEAPSPADESADAPPSESPPSPDEN